MVARPDLHSFPTRRSSDLGSDLSAPSPRSGLLDPAFSALTPRRRPRSEEHTSELQSRFDLVCRLLLEKKKKDSQFTTSTTTQQKMVRMKLLLTSYVQDYII